MRFNRREHHRQRSALVALRDRSSGLTLVELLVAIAVLAFISILGVA
jgi:prepilin-type N-terminal cleavage/methylation domain-containing protein